MLSVLALAAPVAAAADLGWYAGAGAGWSKFNGNVVDINPTLANETYSTTSFDDTDTGWKVFAGYQFHPNWAVELAYTDLGKFSFNANVSGGPGGASATEYGEVKPTCWSLSAVGILPLRDNFSLFGKAGACRWDDHFRSHETTVGGTVIPYPVGSTGTDLTFGVGAKYDFTRNLGVRAEWERFDNVVHDRTSVDLWSVSLQYKF